MDRIMKAKAERKSFITLTQNAFLTTESTEDTKVHFKEQQKSSTTFRVFRQTAKKTHFYAALCVPSLVSSLPTAHRSWVAAN
jgi:hypothetical protein